MHVYRLQISQEERFEVDITPWTVVLVLLCLLRLAILHFLALDRNKINNRGLQFLYFHVVLGSLLHVIGCKVRMRLEDAGLNKVWRMILR